MAASVAYNFYSPGEEVVENAIDGESITSNLLNRLGDLLTGQGIGRHAWVTQEIAKGCKGPLTSSFFKNCTAGWEFNKKTDDLEFIGKATPNYDSTDFFSEQYIAYETGAEATTARKDSELTDDDLAQYGFFKKFNHFKNGESDYSYLYQPISNTVLLQGDEHQWDLLASGIPAMSFAAAANPVNRLNDFGERNFDMETMRNDISQPPWPLEREDTWGDRWLHSDIKDIALPYVHNTFDKMLESGDFK